MKTTILRATLAIMLCTIAVRGWAQDEYIINENFSDYPSNNPNLTEYNNWIVRGCRQGMNGTWNNPSLKVENYIKGNKTEIGYAITPPLNYTGDVIIEFEYARGTSKSSTIDITIQNGGTFENSLNRNSIIVTTGSQAAFYSESYIILNTTEATTIMFSEQNIDNTFAIDNVKVTKIPVIPLKEFSSNSSTIEENATKTVTVNTVRTLTGGIWNTLCLPFNVTKSNLEQTLGTDVQLRTFTGYADNVMAFTPANEIPAGTPFLIKLNTTVENPTFHAVTISDAPAATVTIGDVSFVGTYSPVDLETDGTELFITKNNTLSVPAATTNTMNGMRAYIRVPGTFNPSAARLAIDEPTAIPAINADRPGRSAAVYGLSGRQVAHPRRGLYIVGNRLTFIK